MDTLLDPKMERAVMKLLSERANPNLDLSERCCCFTGIMNSPQSELRIETVNGARRFRLSARSRFTLNVPMVGGALTPIMVRCPDAQGFVDGIYRGSVDRNRLE